MTWASSNPAVAVVDGSGLVTAAGGGMATITATSGTARGTAEVRVFPSDRAALEALYRATDGPNWANDENWLSDARRMLRQSRSSPRESDVISPKSHQKGQFCRPPIENPALCYMACGLGRRHRVGSDCTGGQYYSLR